MTRRSVIRSRLFFAVAALLLCFCFLVGCGSDTVTMRVLAGSELKDLEPLLPDIERETGVTLEFTYSGTLDGVERITAGEPFDAAWFSHGKYLTLLEPERIKAQERIMLSPVTMGIKRSKAEAWGWTQAPVTWRDIAEEAAAGELRFAMTNPASSNSGFTALIGVSAAFAGGADALTKGDIPTDALQRFFRGQALTAGSSGWLADAYVESQADLDGIINYESVLMQMNSSGRLNEPLTLIYPEEGIITADYPLMLLNDEMREPFDRVVAYLRSPEVQRRLMEETQRRPVNPEVALSGAFPDSLLVELPFPNSAEVIDKLVFSYLDEQRVPAHTFFALDVSGSMEGARLADLKGAIDNLAGEDESVTGRFARFSARERVTLLPFSSDVIDVANFTVEDPDAAGADMTAIREYAESLSADGGTAIFSTLAEAYELAAEAQASDPERYYSIVVLSDGDNTEGASLTRFLNVYDGLPEAAKRIRTFTVLFGAADAESMERIAEATGGRVFDSRSAPLSSVFKQIRGYQ